MLIFVLLVSLFNLGILGFLVMKILKGGQVDLSVPMREEFSISRKELNQVAKDLRQELSANLHQTRESIDKRIEDLRDKNDQKLEQIRKTVENKLDNINKDNNDKLEKMRSTVDEKLQSTLEKRLGESFKLVSERLELVQRGLGEMKGLATDVGDFKRILTNVKTRGTWGEIQLESLLEQVFIKDHYEKQVKVDPSSNEVVDYAIKLPDKSNKNGYILLPIDAKFPLEDYQRLVAASEKGDILTIETTLKALINRIKIEAKSISEKYIKPPRTTDFAVLYVPIESLYAEILRTPGLFEMLQSTYRVTIAGPTTISAILNSYQLGFRTLAIAEQTSKVWELLTTIKGEFGKFEDLLVKTKEKLVQATSTLDLATKKTRTIESKLNKVQTLSAKSTKELES
ncbi:DNA recombination protein RmuC [bacterium]|nr:DNA recombination protein RmuC [bacterium]